MSPWGIPLHLIRNLPSYLTVHNDINQQCFPVHQPRSPDELHTEATPPSRIIIHKHHPHGIDESRGSQFSPPLSSHATQQSSSRDSNEGRCRIPSAPTNTEIWTPSYQYHTCSTLSHERLSISETLLSEWAAALRDLSQDLSECERLRCWQQVIALV